MVSSVELPSTRLEERPAPKEVDQQRDIVKINYANIEFVRYVFVVRNLICLSVQNELS